MNVPQRFAYWRDVPALADLASGWQVAEPLRAPFRALGLSCLFMFCVWSLESVRLHRAAVAEESNAREYSHQQDTLKSLRIREKRIRRLMDTDDRIRAIAASGTAAALRLAALSGDLPEDVWITAITPDSNGMMVDGRAADLSDLSAALLRMNGDPILGEPQLLNAQFASRPVAAGLRFTLHLGRPAK